MCYRMPITVGNSRTAAAFTKFLTLELLSFKYQTTDHQARAVLVAVWMYLSLKEEEFVS